MNGQKPQTDEQEEEDTKAPQLVITTSRGCYLYSCDVTQRSRRPCCNRIPCHSRGVPCGWMGGGRRGGRDWRAMMISESVCPWVCATLHQQQFTWVVRKELSGGKVRKWNYSQVYCCGCCGCHLHSTPDSVVWLLCSREKMKEGAIRCCCGISVGGNSAAETTTFRHTPPPWTEWVSAQEVEYSWIGISQ